MTGHRGYGKHDPAGVEAKDIRNGTRAKAVADRRDGPRADPLVMPADRAHQRKQHRHAMTTR
jgi:hypothetical protein